MFQEMKLEFCSTDYGLTTDCSIVVLLKPPADHLFLQRENRSSVTESEVALHVLLW